MWWALRGCGLKRKTTAGRQSGWGGRGRWSRTLLKIALLMGALYGAFTVLRPGHDLPPLSGEVRRLQARAAGCKLARLRGLCGSGRSSHIYGGRRIFPSPTCGAVGAGCCGHPCSVRGFDLSHPLCLPLQNKPRPPRSIPIAASVFDSLTATAACLALLQPATADGPPHAEAILRIEAIPQEDKTSRVRFTGSQCAAAYPTATSISSPGRRVWGRRPSHASPPVKLTRKRGTRPRTAT